ncbi:hypothetical protein BDR22DRAFT_352040 [Usnea florida]
MMPPKFEDTRELPIEYLLSYQYDPAGDNQAAFHKNYQRLVEYRDDLRKQYDRKKETRASLRGQDANPPKGSRFSILPDADDGSSSSALTKPTISASLSIKQLNKLFGQERKAEVRKIKEEIETMKAEMKEQKRKITRPEKKPKTQKNRMIIKRR